jgi:hypothetical protein
VEVSVRMRCFWWLSKPMQLRLWMRHYLLRQLGRCVKIMFW